MKRLSDAQAELIDAFIAEVPSRISTAQLEKDFLISEAFSAFTKPVVHGDHSLSFVLCGGTAVSKVFGYTERISEDIDLRIVLPDGLSPSAKRRLLSTVKVGTLQRLRDMGFGIDEEDVQAGNLNQYMAFPVKYESRYPHDEVLRSELLVEISARNPLLPPVTHTYDTIINQILGHARLQGSIQCLDIRETLAGKNAALLRRWSARTRSVARVFEPGGTRDEDIVRHIYDLGCIFKKFPYYVNDVEVGKLARQLLLKDAKEFGGQDHTFRDAPIKLALDALRDLESSATAEAWYHRFTEAMVYGEIPTFETALAPIVAFAEQWVD